MVKFFSRALLQCKKDMFLTFTHFESAKENTSFEKCCYKIVVKFFSCVLPQCETDVFLTFTQFEYGQQEFTLKNKCDKIVVKFFSRALQRFFFFTAGLTAPYGEFPIGILVCFFKLKSQ